MTDDHFQQIAARRRWSDRTQVAVLLDYVRHQDCDAAFPDSLEGKAEDPDYDAADEFLWVIADRLQHRGLVLDAQFQRFCADAFDLFTPEEAAAEWQRCTAARRSSFKEICRDTDLASRSSQPARPCPCGAGNACRS